MDDARIGGTLRIVRMRRRLRQGDVAARAGTSRATVGRVERGGVHQVPVETLRRIASALGLQVSIVLRSPGGDLDRVVNAAHADLHEAVVRHLGTLGGWIWQPEVSFSIFGERGVIDLLAWHAASRSLLIIELKTMLVDPQELVAVMGRRVRLGQRIARDLGWAPATVSAWVIVLDGRTNRRRRLQHSGLLRAAFPTDGRTMRGWLRTPTGRVSALSFWPDVAHMGTSRKGASVRRVRPRGEELVGAPTSVAGGKVRATPASPQTMPGAYGSPRRHVAGKAAPRCR
jgi:transcriptional regulator with XRE-family HTH domain